MVKNNKKTKERGYAILFTVVIVAIISTITMGLLNAAYKQVILSSVARDSTIAFYQSDIASECALYADNEFNMVPPPGNVWNCAGYDLKFTSVGDTYEISPEDETSTDKCFRVTTIKQNMGDYISTKISAGGYNICNKSGLRTVERSVEVTY